MKMRICFWSVCLLLILVSSLVWGKSCDQCHSVDKIAPEAIYFHSPFSQNKCEKCHGTSSAEEIDLENVEIKWFLKKEFLGGKAYFLLPKRLKNYTLIFDAKELKKPIVLSKPINLPKSKEKPTIQKIWLCGLSKGLWLEVDICVITNKPTEVYISCDGIEKSSEGEYFTYHQIELARIKKDRYYQCKISAKDIFGKVSIIENFSFSPKGSIIPVSVGKAKKIYAKLYQSPDKELLLSVNADGRTKFRLGIVKNFSGQGILKVENVKDHPVLSSLRWAALEACYQCHNKRTLGASHPVGIPLKQGMNLRGFLPIYDGVITCATCHNPHGGLESNYLRQQGPELCINCHTTKKVFPVFK